MITKEKILRDFDYCEEKGEFGFYYTIWKPEQSNSEFELFFTGKRKDISTSQVEKFINFTNHLTDLKYQIENYIDNDLLERKPKNKSKFINGLFEIYIVSVFDGEQDCDIEVICAKSYQGFLFKKRAGYIVAIQSGVITEIKRASK